jgi:hypothetical protein
MVRAARRAVIRLLDANSPRLDTSLAVVSFPDTRPGM